MAVKKIKLDSIRLDGGTQSRASIDAAVVSDYVDALRGDAQFPPITVFQDGPDIWLGDGFHRVAAMKQLGWKRVPADIKAGTLRDAILFSVGANAAHGLRRSNVDKRRAVAALLKDEEWGRWSDSEISRRCGVSQQFVSKLRHEIEPSLTTVVSDGDKPKSSNTTSERTYVDRHGNVSTMNTTRIGRAAEGIGTDEFDPFEEVEPAPPIEFAALRIQLKTDLRTQGLPIDRLDEIDGLNDAQAGELADFVRAAKVEGDWLGIFEDWFGWTPKVSDFADFPDSAMAETKLRVLDWIERMAWSEEFDPATVDEWGVAELDRAWVEINNSVRDYPDSVIKLKTGRSVPEWYDRLQNKTPPPPSQQHRSLFQGLARLLDQFGKQLRNVRGHFHSLTASVPADRPERAEMGRLNEQIDALLNSVDAAALLMEKGPST